MKKIRRFFAVCLSVLMMNIGFNSCQSQFQTQTTSEAEAENNSQKEDVHIADRSGFYLPSENVLIDYENDESEWSFTRCLETEHFYIFWAKEFGEDPSSDNVPYEMRVDLDTLADVAEQCYQTNVEELHMVDEDYASHYKLQIYLEYNKDWLATGSGYDDTVGALWVSPMACQPAGSTIAHEIGHCFQYLVYAEQLSNGTEDNSRTGFRYTYGNGEGNAYWELSAQWQSWQDYPSEMFTDYEMDVWFENYQDALENEYTRYQNYWWFYYLTEKYGKDAFSRIWKESKDQEDSYTCFRRLYLENDLDAFYADLYEYAAKCVTFDFEAAEPYSEKWMGRYQTKFYESADGMQQVAYADCPEANGFTAVRIEPEETDSTITLNFRGIDPGSPLGTDDPGEYRINDLYDDSAETEFRETYNNYDQIPGWRYGFVAITTDHERIYGECYSERENIVSFDYPANTAYLYFVVLGAPEQYEEHIWDTDGSTDVQMPFEISYALN